MMGCAGLDDPSCRRQHSADNASEQEVICKKKARDGSVYNVTIEQLKKCLLKVCQLAAMPYLRIERFKSITCTWLSVVTYACCILPNFSDILAFVL